MIGLLLVVLAQAPCDDVARSSAALESAKTAGDLLFLTNEQRQSTGITLLRPSEEDLPRERARLLAAERLRSACALSTSNVTAPRGDAAALKAVMDRPEFYGARDRDADALQQWFRRLMDWLESLLGERPAQTFADSMRLVVLGLAVVVAALIALRLARTRFGKRAESAQRAEAAPLVLLDPGEHLSKAGALLASDPREALREGLLSLLSSLERKRLARPDRVKTNRELARELPERGATPALAQAVRELLTRYDRTFYSLEPVASETASAFLQSVSELQRSLEAGT